MSLLRALFMITLFFIDVHVRAEEKPAADCWGKQIPCAIRAEKRREVKGEGFAIVLGEGTTVERSAKDSVRLVAGDVLLRTEDVKTPVKFQTPYGSFWCVGEGAALVSRELDQVTLKALAGSWIVHRLGDNVDYALAPGLQVSVGEVQTDGMARMEFPQSLPWTPTLNAWADLYTGKKEDFKSEVAAFREEWKKAVESAADVQARIAARTVASHEAGLAKDAARRKAEQDDESAMRRLFREKNGLDH